MKEMDRKNKKTTHINGTPKMELTLTKSVFQWWGGGEGTRVIDVLSQWKSLACMITSSETKTSPSSINAPRSRREITTEDKCRNQVNKSARENVTRQLRCKG